MSNDYKLSYILYHNLLSNINMINCDGNTPLMLSIKKGHLNLSMVLLNKDACVNIRNIDGDTALHFASSYIRHNKINKNNQHIIVRKLIEKGSFIDAVNNHGVTPLLISLQHFCPNATMELLLHNPNIMIKSINNVSVIRLYKLYCSGTCSFTFGIDDIIRTKLLKCYKQINRKYLKIIYIYLINRYSTFYTNDKIFKKVTDNKRKRK